MTKKEQKEASAEELGEITLNDSSSSALNTDELEKAFAKKESSSANKGNHSTLSDEDYEKLKNELLYLRAEFDNYRKNAIKERADALKFGAEKYIRQILMVVDNFDRALSMQITPENYKDFIAGIEMTSNEFKTQLANMGVTIEDPVGKPFDPTIHEALSSEESSDIEPGHITRVFQKGYKLHDKIIRPAQVVVAKEPSQSKNNEDMSEETES